RRTGPRAGRRSDRDRFDRRARMSLDERIRASVPGVAAATGLAQPDRPAPAGALPALVRDIELTEPVPTIAGFATDGRRVERAWLLVRLHTEPIGSVLLDVPEGGL